jgi:hypothetical protein
MSVPALECGKGPLNEAAVRQKDIAIFVNINVVIPVYKSEIQGWKVNQNSACPAEKGGKHNSFWNEVRFH